MVKFSDLTKELEQHLGCTFVSQTPKGNNKEWRTVFVLDGDTSIGRLTFKHDSLYYVKSYKKDYRRDICNTDKIFFRFERWRQDQVIITDFMFNLLEDIAFQTHDLDLDRKAKWRADNPKFDKQGNFKPRKKLEGANPRYILKLLIMNVEIGPKYMESIQELIKNHYKVDIDNF